MRLFQYFHCCVGWPEDEVQDLIDMIDSAIGITRKTFLKHVDRQEFAGIESSLGYKSHPTQGLTMAGDFHVTYHRSTYKDKRTYFFQWSGVEYVFMESVDDELE